MEITPTSERTITKAIPSSENHFPLLNTNDLSNETDRMSHSDEILSPLKVPIHFNEGIGYAGTFPTSKKVSLWPGPRGGAFIWLTSSNGMGSNSGSESSSGSYMQAKQKVKLHRLEIQLTETVGGFEDESTALYTCRESNLKVTNPTLSFLKKIFTNPRKTLIHPVNTFSGLESRKRSSLTLLADFPFGAMGGRDPRPVIWNSLKGNVTEFDPKSLKSRDEHDILKGSHAISSQSIYDETSGLYLMIQRSDGIGSDRRYSQFRILIQLPNLPRLATFMAPGSLSLDLVACTQNWITCTAIFNNRRLFYLINRLEGRMMAVYQTQNSNIKHFVRLRNVANDTSLELIVLMTDGALRRYLFPKLAVEVARFDGAAGLLTSFPVSEFETINDGPFDQVNTIKSGFLGKSGSFLYKLNEKFATDQSISLYPQRLNDFSLFEMDLSGQSCVVVIGIDPYMGRVTMNLVDSCDLDLLAKVPLGILQSDPTSFSQLIYIPTRPS